MSYIQLSALDFACKFNAPELRTKLSFWENNPEGVLPSHVRSMRRVLTLALEFKRSSPYHVAVCKEEVKKLPSVKVTVDDFKGVDSKDASHYVFIEERTSKLLSERGYSYEFHYGWNDITERRAEKFIPLLRGSLRSVKSRSDSKKMEGFIEMLISSYSPEFYEKWMRDTHTSLMCDVA